MKMIRKPTFSGKVEEKDERDILFWAQQKSPFDRLVESWRLHCLNHGLEPSENRLKKNIAAASKRNV